MHKEFDNEFGKIRYFSAILKNQLPSFKEIQQIDKTINYELSEMKYNPRPRKKSLKEFENEVVINNQWLYRWVWTEIS